MEPLVMHVDVDSFFAQVEQLRNPALQGLPIAVQQHQDIIAANHAAKAAGVRKHMEPQQARRALAAVGGRTVHVHTEAGGRVSYQPYRRTSAALMRLLHDLPWAAVVERASIDDAYILIDPGAAPDGGGAASSGTTEITPSQRGSAAAGAGMWRRSAEDVRSRVRSELGLAVSVGVAPNKLLAKLASAAAKPDGVLVVDSEAATQQLLASTPARRLPQMGGQVAQAFQRSAIHTIADLQPFTTPQLEQLLGVKPAVAQQLHGWARGLDPSPVQEREPPRTLSVQMTLTLVPRPMPAALGRVSASGGQEGMFEPLAWGAADFRPRLQKLVGSMAADLLERVEDDREENSRWPRTMAVQTRTMADPGSESKTSNMSCAFPLRSLGIGAGATANPGAVTAPSAGSSADSSGALLETLSNNFARLAVQALQGCAPNETLVELRLSATNFGSSAAATEPPITAFFRQAAAQAEGAEQSADAAASASAQQQQQEQQQKEQQQQQQQQQQPQPGTPARGAAQCVTAAPTTPQQPSTAAPVPGASPAAIISAQPQPAAYPSLPFAAEAPEGYSGMPPGPDAEAAVAAGRRELAHGKAWEAGEEVEGSDLDLGSVDLAEQQRILTEIRLLGACKPAKHAQRSRPVKGSPAGAKRKSEAGSTGSREASKKGRGAIIKDHAQPRLESFFTQSQGGD